VVKIGKRLKQTRVQALLTQQELADRAGLQFATVSRIENDHVDPHFSSIKKLAKALGIDPSELVKEER
jgi:transcriptional regulator with XRE-family HTH domain